LTSLWQVRDFNIVREWTLKNYQEIFARPVWLTVLLRTVLIAAGVTITSAVLSFPLAYYVARLSSPRWRYLLYLAVLVPLWSSYLVRVFAWKTILGRNGTQVDLPLLPKRDVAERILDVVEEAL